MIDSRVDGEEWFIWADDLNVELELQVYNKRNNFWKIIDNNNHIYKFILK